MKQNWYFKSATQDLKTLLISFLWEQYTKVGKMSKAIELPSKQKKFNKAIREWISIGESKGVGRMT